MKVDPVRLSALDILIAVDGGGALDPELSRVLDRLPEPRDRGFLAELVRGTLQWQGRYDHLIAQFVRKKPPSDKATRCLLRLSLHQMLGMDSVPPYAAIHQAGELCRRKPGPRKVPFINGLLQSVRREVLGKEPAQPDGPADLENRLRAYFEKPGDDPARGLAAWQSHPLWLVRRWIANFGFDRAESICAWNNRAVPVVFHVLAPADPDLGVELLAESGCRVKPGPVPRSLVAAERISRRRLEEIMARFPWLIVQDPTVQEATSWLLGEVADRTENRDIPVLDMCAAPGGKTAFLSSRWPKGGRVVAMDNRRDRVRLLESTVKRIEADRVDVLLAEGTRAPFRPDSFGAVLLDGPCSGTGVLRHHPDGRWRLKIGLPAKKGAFLAKLADRAADLVKPGGLLMYATCSLEPEENGMVVEDLLARRGDLEPAPDTEGRWRRLWLPGDSSGTRGDGFFAARLRKKD